MRKIIYLFLLLLFVNTKGKASNQKDSVYEIHTLISNEALRNGKDPALAVRAFDLIIKLFKVKQVSFVLTKTGMSHYSVLKRSILINIEDGKDSITQKVFEELTHAVQFTWKPAYYTANALGIFVKTFVKAVFYKDREKYRQKIDSLRRDNSRPCSGLRSAFIGIYLVDAYCEYDNGGRCLDYPLPVRHENCDTKSFEHEHPKIEQELWRLYNDLIFLLQHFSDKEAKSWLKMRKKQLHRDLR